MIDSSATPDLEPAPLSDDSLMQVELQVGPNSFDFVLRLRLDRMEPDERRDFIARPVHVGIVIEPPLIWSVMEVSPTLIVDAPICVALEGEEFHRATLAALERPANCRLLVSAEYEGAVVRSHQVETRAPFWAMIAGALAKGPETLSEADYEACRARDEDRWRPADLLLLAQLTGLAVGNAGALTRVALKP